MTTSEIMQANLLDILFDGRNKEYGAYTIRRGYNQRLVIALAIGLAFILLLIIMNSFASYNHSSITGTSRKDSVQLITIDNRPDKIPDPVKPKPLPQQTPAVKTIKSATPLIVPDNTLKKTEATENQTINDNAIGITTTEGEPSTGVITNTPPVTGTGTEPAVTIPDPAPSFPPEFPGGFKALQEFLARNLNTPDNLEIGEKKIVKARFFVDKDGSVSTVEIDVSAGTVFDKEVIRVCKKMPKWKPAVQNGHAIAVSYVLPVTFIGVEQ